MAKITTMCLLF